MRKFLATILSFLIVSPSWATVTFMDPGSDATQDITTFYATSGGTVISSNDISFTGPRSIKFSSGAGPSVATLITNTGILSDVGTQIHVKFRLDALPTNSGGSIILPQTAAGGTMPNVQINASGLLRIANSGITTTNGKTPIIPNTWNDVCLSFFITDSTHFQFAVYLNGKLELIQTVGTLTNTGASKIVFGITSGPTLGANKNYWYDDIYVVTGNAGAGIGTPDTGDIRVVAKRPFANGTTNGFTGSGTPSSYGSGNARYVNEQPLNTANLVSIIGAGVATTEEYNIEAKSVGDVDMTFLKPIAAEGWVFASSLAGETAQLIFNGANTAISLTNTNTLFSVFTGTNYPAGTGADIGLQTDTSLTTVSLYECGIIMAYQAGYQKRLLVPIGRF